MPRAVGVVPVRFALIVGAGHQQLVLAGQTLRLGDQRLLERQWLAAAPHAVLIVRVGSADRVAEQKDNLRLRQRLANARRHARIEHVVRARLETHRQRRLGRSGGRLWWKRRKVHPVPALAAREMQVEVVNLLGQRRSATGVARQIIEQRRGARLLSPGDDELRQSPPVRGNAPVPAAGRGDVARLANRRRLPDAGHQSVPAHAGSLLKKGRRA